MGKRRNQQFQIQRTPGSIISVEGKYEGPLPLPAHLEKYEAVLPGAAERIMAMAEKQSDHRRGLETKVVNSDIANSRLGLIFGFIIAMLGISGGVFLINNGKIVEGSIFSGLTVVSLVGAFVYGSQQRRKERLANQQILQR